MKTLAEAVRMPGRAVDLRPSQQSSGSQVALRRGPVHPPRVVERFSDHYIPRAVWSPIKEDGKPREIVRALADDEREALQLRRDELGYAIAPFGPDEDDRVAAAISGMFAGFRSMRQDESAAVAIIHGTKRALSCFPAWAIEAGCLSIQRGEAGLDKRFAPNDTEIYSVIDKAMKYYRDRLQSAEALLCAPVEAPRQLQSNYKPILNPEKSGGGDGQHGARVRADLEQRKQAKLADADAGNA